VKKIFLSLLLLTACSGSFTGGESNLAGPLDNNGGGGQEVALGGDTSLSGSEGTLGSQSTSSDIEVTFYRDYALDFENDSDPNDVLVERPMAGTSQAFTTGKIRKVSSIKSVELQVAPVLGSRWVRAINCGNFSDSEIAQLIPPQNESAAIIEDDLLWLVLNLPRPDKPGAVKCQNPSYRDFPISLLGTVSLAELKAAPQDLLFFLSVGGRDFAEGGALSVEGDAPLSDAQWLALARPRLRIVRLLPAGTIRRLHPIPASLQKMQ
jgi:hypothetical protein